MRTHSTEFWVEMAESAVHELRIQGGKEEEPHGDWDLEVSAAQVTKIARELCFHFGLGWDDWASRRMNFLRDQAWSTRLYPLQFTPLLERLIEIYYARKEAEDDEAARSDR